MSASDSSNAADLQFWLCSIFSVTPKILAQSRYTVKGALGFVVAEIKKPDGTRSARRFRFNTTAHQMEPFHQIHNVLARRTLVMRFLDAGLTQSETSKFLDVSQATVNNDIKVTGM